MEGRQTEDKRVEEDREGGGSNFFSPSPPSFSLPSALKKREEKIAPISHLPRLLPLDRSVEVLEFPDAWVFEYQNVDVNPGIIQNFLGSFFFTSDSREIKGML